MDSVKFSDVEIVERFLSLSENDFSKNILVPLFEEIYRDNGKVSFTGGSNEKGKDIVIETIDKFLLKTVIAIQVKKVKWSANANNNSMQTLNIQLFQTLDEPIVSIDNAEQLFANRFIAITPYIISPTVLEHHGHSYRKAVQGKQVDFFDGKRIITLLREYKPELIQKMFGRGEEIKRRLFEKLDHEELKIALGLDNIKSLKDIYCTSNILAGGFHCREFLESTISESKENIVKTDRVSAERILKINNSLECEFKISIIEEGTKLVVEDKDNEIEKYNNSKSRVEELVKSISVSGSGYTTDSEVIESINLLKKIKELSERNEINLLINATHKAESLHIQTDENRDVIRKLKDSLNIHRKLKDSIESDVIFIPLRLKILIRELENKKRLLRELNSQKDNIREYLITAEEISKLISTLSLFKNNISFEKIDGLFSNYKPVSIMDAFNTGLNIAVLGEAGTGKTTNLKNYARQLLNNKDNFTIFATLSDICKECNGVKSKDLEDGLLCELKKLSSSISKEDLIQEMESKRSHIILDSIDEAISDNDWVIESIIGFSKKYPKAQIIISSRYSIQEIDRIPFSHIDLLPFSVSQRNEFLTKWFCDSTIVNQIIAHLENNKGLADIVVNPLSATILCTLKENAISLPRNEYELYNERFNLLAGKFDIAKRIKRLDTNADVLLSVAQYSALQVHRSKSRDFSKKKLISYIKKSYRKTGPESIELIYRDLIKSEIIVKDHYSKHSFGHLKFQEYLASKEILSDRDFKVKTLFSSPWWHEVMLLCAKGSRDIDWIINYALDNDIESSSINILTRITNECVDDESLKGKWLSKVKTLGFKDERFHEFEDDDNDFYNQEMDSF